MKRWKFSLLHNWQIKLAALVLATGVWLLVRHHIVQDAALAKPGTVQVPIPR